MAKAKHIVAEKSLFELTQLDKAKKTVFEGKRAIMFQGQKKHVKGTIEVRPDADGGATIKCRVFKIYSIMCKSLKVPCADENDFERAFDEARHETIKMMDLLLSQSYEKRGRGL